MKAKVFNREGELVGPIDVDRVVKTDEEWRAQLTPDQYKIARRREPNGRSAAAARQQAERRLCLCLLWAAAVRGATKFHSGTGWPSFFQAIGADNVVVAVIEATAWSDRKFCAPVRLPPGTRLRRWPGADGFALLRQLGIAGVL